ncbi:hypothetical protein BD626DRAFT_488096 [Schizophyllum amplum]|uniref:Uncharacterized protein n=1 Tax=Schizophyllum amplum TaxID=97359 RepID=A0A550CKC6_9AGAR|nr:hypothetical protein BD626DRAFT_488096 [Auriculariopsis ampla]
MTQVMQLPLVDPRPRPGGKGDNLIVIRLICLRGDAFLFTSLPSTPTLRHERASFLPRKTPCIVTAKQLTSWSYLDLEHSGREISESGTLAAASRSEAALQRRASVWLVPFGLIMTRARQVPLPVMRHHLGKKRRRTFGQALRGAAHREGERIRYLAPKTAMVPVSATSIRLVWS